MLEKIQVVRAPKHRLATFGASRIDYQIVTDVAGLPDRSRLRTGLVIAERPSIITAEALREQFQGFSSDARKYVDALVTQYGEALRGLEYQFKNEPVSSRVELKPPDQFVLDLARDFDRSGGYNQAVIRGSDRLWELSLMKFIVEETLSSFASNVRELQDRGFFNAEEKETKRRQSEIENLFRAAQLDRKAVPVLAAKLKQYGLFEAYQDRFFKLVNR